MMFGDTVLKKVQDDDTIGGKMVKSGKSDAEIIDELFVRAYARKPLPQELIMINTYVAQSSEHGVARKKVFDDLLWTVVTSKEFMVNY